MEGVRTGDGGSIMSVSVNVVMDDDGSVRRAAARAWPMNPPAPVMMMFVFVDGGDIFD